MIKSKAISSSNASTQAVRALTVIVFILMALLVNAHSTIVNMPREYTFWTPPDLTKGGFAKINEPDEIHLLNFSMFIHTYLYTWHKDGREEFPNMIDNLRYYLSSDYYQVLKGRAAKEGNAFKNRERAIHLDLSNINLYKVKRLGNGKWHITVAIRVVDSVARNTIKDEYIQYFYVVESVHLPRSQNPFGLQITGEFAPSTRV
ncbi:MAG: hypothetical protein CMK64_05175 [Pseudoalteromonas sp.]|nr:hypothetical protein [Pseudoalteromonas sp.]|tara:strand:- start:45220 stop:45828 length:609 start_codon:yes stop_codon:yes gene_type:complete